MKAELIDHMGSDLTVVNAARVSFNRESDWEYHLPFKVEGEPYKEDLDFTLSEQDQKLISYLAKHDHWTPFSHVQIQMRETVPLFVARQRFKHVIGFTYNEISRRYVDDKPEFYFPFEWRKSADDKKQGSSEETITGYVASGFWISLNTLYANALQYASYIYDDLIEAGVAPEQARMVLPQSMYTSYYVTGSLAAWARAYRLRSDNHAQKEIQELASQWNKIISNLPELKYSWTALVS